MGELLGFDPSIVGVWLVRITVAAVGVAVLVGIGGVIRFIGTGR